MIKMKQKTIGFATLLAFLYLAAPFAPAICHAFTHAVDVEVSAPHDHAEDAHQHEHDAKHHALPLGEEVPAIVSNANKVLLQQAIDHDVLQVNLFFDGVLAPSVNQGYSIKLEPPIPRVEEMILYGHPANAPPV